MANRWQKAMGGAATGAAVGGPWGALIGGVGAFLTGSDKRPVMPELQLSPEALKSYNFIDVDLERTNPALYRKLMESDAMLTGMRQALASRREGMTANEQRQMNDYMAQQGSGMASSNLAGTPIGNAMMADAAARLQTAAQDRAFQEYVNMQGNLAQQQGANFNQWSGALGSGLDVLNRNRQAALGLDKMRHDQKMLEYGAAMDQQAASDAMWNSMLSGGLQATMGLHAQGKDPLLGDWGNEAWKNIAPQSYNNAYVGEALRQNPNMPSGEFYNKYAYRYGSDQVYPSYNYKPNPLRR